MVDAPCGSFSRPAKASDWFRRHTEADTAR
jgi:hypothetical protein